MPRLVYDGPHDGVEVVMPDGRRLTVMRGGEEEFPKQVADDLVAQGTWAPAKAPKTEKEG